MLDPFHRVTECPGWTFVNRLDDHLTRRRIRVNPRFLVSIEDRFQFIGAITDMRAEASIIMNRDGLSDVIVSFV